MTDMNDQTTGRTTNTDTTSMQDRQHIDKGQNANGGLDLPEGEQQRSTIGQGTSQERSEDLNQETRSQDESKTDNQQRRYQDA